LYQTKFKEKYTMCHHL